MISFTAKYIFKCKAILYANLSRRFFATSWTSSFGVMMMRHLRYIDRVA